eukprot:NODE_281_length_10828_cov_0.749837.p9 type:complete len:100 gc:universal NODE_281_length_10828_cov_0.749837:3787-3488(-)
MLMTPPFGNGGPWRSPFELDRDLPSKEVLLAILLSLSELEILFFLSNLGSGSDCLLSFAAEVGVGVVAAEIRIFSLSIELRLLSTLNSFNASSNESVLE